MTLINNIKCLNLSFVNGIASTFINCPFLVNELQIIALSMSIPALSGSNYSYFVGSIAANPATVLTASMATYTSTFTASIATNVLNITAMTTGTIYNGMLITVGASAGTLIQSQISGNIGGIGLYTLSQSQTVASIAMAATINNQLNVSAVSSGTLEVGMIINNIGLSYLTNTTVLSQISGAIGGIGIYILSQQQTRASGTIYGAIPSNTLTVSSFTSGLPLQINTALSGPSILPNTYITGFGTGSGGSGTYYLNQPYIIPSGTSFTGTIIPMNIQEIQTVIFSNLLPDGTSPVGYLVDNLIGGVESSSSSSSIIYHYNQPKPIMGNYQFSLNSYLGVLQNTLSLNVIVFVDFRLRQ
jgi:hypothetical protein